MPLFLYHNNHLGQNGKNNHAMIQQSNPVAILHKFTSKLPEGRVNFLPGITDA
jgi:hypothetical protein